MEGIYFYVFAWSGWIMATFWMKRGSARLYTAISFLFVIIGTAFHFSLGPFQFYGSYIVITLIAILILYQIKWLRTVYIVFCSGIVAILYATLQLIILYDPVWFLFSRTWISGGIVAILTILIVQKYIERLIVLCFGIMQGEILFAVVIEPLHVHNDSPSLYALDILLCSLVIISFTTSIGKSFSYVQPFKQKHIREGKRSL